MASLCWSLAKTCCYNLGLEHRLIGKLRVSASAPCSTWQSCICMTGDAAPVCLLMSSTTKILHSGQHLLSNHIGSMHNFLLSRPLISYISFIQLCFLYDFHLKRCVFLFLFSYFYLPLSTLKSYINPLLKKHDLIIAKNMVQRTSWNSCLVYLLAICLPQFKLVPSINWFLKSINPLEIAL